MATVFFISITAGLIVLFIVSFSLFIRKMLNHSSLNSNRSAEIEKKLDRIIELLEKEKKS
ncbi:MAG TPA: DUF4083 domain-containing protein [Bacillaceae bacterium]